MHMRSILAIFIDTAALVLLHVGRLAEAAILFIYGKHTYIASAVIGYIGKTSLRTHAYVRRSLSLCRLLVNQGQPPRLLVNLIGRQSAVIRIFRKRFVTNRIQIRSRRVQGLKIRALPVADRLYLAQPARLPVKFEYIQSFAAPVGKRSDINKFF